MRRRYWIGSPFSLRVVLMYATLPAIVSIRVRCANKPDAPMSSASNMWFLRNTILKRHLQRAELPSHQLDDEVMQQRILRVLAHQLFHRAVVAVVEQDAAARLLDVADDVAKTDRARGRVVALFDPVAQHRLELLRRQILLPIAGRARVGHVLGEQPMSRLGEAQRLLEQRPVSLVEQSFNEHRGSTHRMPKSKPVPVVGWQLLVVSCQ